MVNSCRAGAKDLGSCAKAESMALFFAGLLAICGGSPDDPPFRTRPASDKPVKATPIGMSGANDLYGDPLAPGAIARMGSQRLQHEPYVHAIAFSPDGKTLVSGGWSKFDPTIRFWDVATGKERLRIGERETKGDVQSLALTPDGKLLACAYDNVIVIWDMASGKKLRVLTAGGRVKNVAFSPDGKTLASGVWSEAPAVRLWETATGRAARALLGHDNIINSVAFSPKGDLLASTDESGNTKIWDAKTGTLMKSLASQWHSDAVAFSPDGKTVTTRHRDGTVFCWDVRSARRTFRFPGRFKLTASDEENVRMSGLAYAPDGRFLAHAGSPTDHAIYVRDTATGKEVRRFPGRDIFTCLAFSPDGKILAAAGHDWRIRLWVVATGEELLRFAGHEADILAEAFSPDAKVLATGDRDGQMIFWNTATGKELRRSGQHRGPVGFITYSPSGNLLASGTGGIIYLTKADSGQEIRQLAAHPKGVSCARFSPDGKVLASAGDDSKIKLWEVASGNAIRQFACPGGDGQEFAFSEEFGKVVSANGKGDITIWEVETGKRLRTWSVKDIVVGYMALSGDGRFVAAGGPNGSIRIWSAVTGEATCFIHVDTDEFYYFTFFPDGTKVVSGSSGLTRSSGMIRIWDVHSGKQCGQVEGGQKGITSLALSPDGKVLATSSPDRTTIIFDGRKLVKQR
jgi:WD40 repeat protein